MIRWKDASQLPHLSLGSSALSPPSLASLTAVTTNWPEFLSGFLKECSFLLECGHLSFSIHLLCRWELPPWFILPPCSRPRCLPGECQWPNSTWKPPQPPTDSGTGNTKVGDRRHRAGLDMLSEQILLFSLKKKDTEFMFSNLVYRCFDGRTKYQ